MQSQVRTSDNDTNMNTTMDRHHYGHDNHGLSTAHTKMDLTSLTDTASASVGSCAPADIQYDCHSLSAQAYQSP